MVGIVLLSVVFLSIAFYEVPGLIRRKMWRELTAFSVILAIGFGMSLGLAVNLQLPNPSRIIAWILNIRY